MVKREELYFDSRDNENKIHAMRWIPDVDRPVCVLQIIHGMAEYVERYDEFAREIRDITESRFFLDVYTCNRNDRKNGTLERIVGDMVILCNYPEAYKKDSKRNFKWLNENASISNFEEMNRLLADLTASVEATKEIRQLFNNKHAHLFVAAFKTFVESGRKGTEYGNFLNWFIKVGCKTEIGGNTWEMFGINRSTRDTYVVHGKLDYLIKLIKHYSDTISKAA